ncbi:MAG: tetratricopeptide repeat protein [Bacteroidales bacterium]|jgi:AraC-like DNA-binding protein|nr:tetratricopeptide repeat protein [Bacteroidales bacterium]
MKLQMQGRFRERCPYSILLISTCILFITVGVATGQWLPPNEDIVSKYKHLSPQQLVDSSNYHYRENNIDEALVCLDLLINMAPQNVDVEFQEIMIEAYHRYAIIYFHMDNYRIAYEFLLKALQLSEATNDLFHRSRIYISIGNIYHRLGKQDIAKTYFTEALDFTHDEKIISLILNNLGYASLTDGDLEDVHHLLTQSMQIAEEHNPSILPIVLHSMAAYYQKVEAYDSAYRYFLLSIEHAEKSNNHQNRKSISLSLSDLGQLFFEINKPDSAIFYINQSNIVSSENDFFGVLMDNYLLLSKIAESKGDRMASFEYFRQYSTLKDQILDHEKIVEINQLQRLHEASKTNRQIEQFTLIQQAQNRVIRYQKTIQYILASVLLLISTILAFVFMQNKKLNTAYRRLFEKDLEIIEFQKSSPEIHLEKYKKSALSDEMQNELLTQFYALMEDVSVVCNPELSVEMLAGLLNSNRAYVSQVVNDVLKKNFRAIINDYRIREAQRLFSEADASKYTIESIALKTGFKSRNTFSDAFKEITGVSPSFYLKSMQSR